MTYSCFLLPMNEFDFPVTLYHRGFSSFHRVECRWLTWEFKWCQFYLGTFRHHLKLSYASRHNKSQINEFFNGNSHLVIIEGWGHPDHIETKEIWTTNQGVRRLKHLPFSELWAKDFDTWIQNYIQATPESDLLLDVRKHDFSLELSIVPSPTGLSEGAMRSVTLSTYERNPKARGLCIEHYGTACVACGFDFARTYGEVARDDIHVHHLTPLSSIGEKHEVNPVTDLRPVCPNCHAVIHRRSPPFTIEEVQVLLRQTSQQFQ